MSENTTIYFRYDATKAVQAVLWFLHKHGGTMDKMKLIKLVYIADREHLKLYGRPIVGGRYFAMKHGPVTSELLDHINNNDCGRDFLLENKRTVIAQGPLYEKYLSESDVLVLTKIDEEFGMMGTGRLRNLTHDFKAWQKNYPNPDENTSRAISYEDMLSDVEVAPELIETITDDQEIRNFFE